MLAIHRFVQQSEPDQRVGRHAPLANEPIAERSVVLNTADFVRAIEAHLRDPEPSTILSLIRDPPGARPHEGLVQLAQWFNKLSEADQRMIEKVICISVDCTIHAMLTTLDGSNKITNEKGEFEVSFVTNNGERILVSDGGRAIANELFKVRFDWEGKL